MSASTVAIPNVVGQSINVATTDLVNAGLKVGDVTFANSTLQQGFVVSTDPKAGISVKPGTKVNIVESKGPVVPVVVPSVQGQSVAAAEAALHAKGLGYTTVAVQSWSQPVVPGTVLTQQPAGGATANTGTTVQLTILATGGTYPIPDVSGQNQAAAGGTLGQYGLTVGTSSTTQCSGSIASGNVVSTSPPAGTPVAAGTIVNLVVSSGACPVTVPNVVGLDVNTAQTQITNAGLQYQDVTNCPLGQSSTGIIASQSPQALQKVQPGTVIQLYLGCQ